MRSKLHCSSEEGSIGINHEAVHILKQTIRDQDLVLYRNYPQLHWKRTLEYEEGTGGSVDNPCRCRFCA